MRPYINIGAAHVHVVFIIICILVIAILAITNRKIKQWDPILFLTALSASLCANLVYAAFIENKFSLRDAIKTDVSLTN